MKIQEALHGRGSRTLVWWVITAALLAYGVWRYPVQFQVFVAGAYLPTLGYLLGIQLDRFIFHWARPSTDNDNALWQLRRQIGGCSFALCATLLR